MKHFIILILLFTFCNAFGQFSCDYVETQESTAQEINNACENYKSNIQNSPLPYHSVPSKNVRIMVHIVADENGQQNYQNNPTDIARIDENLTDLNAIQDNLIPQLPLGSCVPESQFIPDSKINYVNQGYKFYQHPEFYCTDTKCGQSSNEVYNYCITDNPNLTASEKNDNLHIIIVGHRGKREENEYCDSDRSGCDEPVYYLGGLGPSNYIIVRGLYESTDENGIATLLAHELGHSLGLRHSWVDQCCDTGGSIRKSNNVMDYSGTYTQLHAFTQCQLGIMHYNLENGPFKKFVETNYCEKQSGEVEIPSGVSITWDTDEIVSQDVVVYGELTITCTVEMAEDTRIYVKEGGKLIVDGGTITSYCESYWSGIKVAGGNSDFDIKVFNGSIIESTDEAAITMWPTSPDDPGNGILHAENSNFNNVKGMVGFWAPSTQINSSYVNNCVQNGGKWGVSNTNCQRILITNNRFYDILNECVYSSNGALSISGNLFYGGQVDILFTNTFSGFSSTVENNTFNGSNTGYISMGPSLSQTQITQNEFNNAQFNVINDGFNNFRAEYNTFYGNMGVVSFNNGNGMADVGYNTFFFNFIGTMPIGDNSDFNFYENCFSSYYSDVYIDGEVSSIIHSNGEAANNCFTHQGLSSSSILDISGNITPFTYLEPADDDVDCRDAILADPNVTRDYFGTPDFPECRDGFNPPIPFANPCFPGESEGEILWAITWLTNKIQEIEDNQNLNQAQKDKLIAIYQKCLRRVQGMLSELYAEDGEYDEAIQVFDGNNSLEVNISTYSIYLIANDLISAENFLISVNDRSDEWNDFKTIQLLNLESISNRAYQYSEFQLNTIQGIAQKSTPVSAFAKSLFYNITGELLNSAIPEINSNGTRKISEKEDEIKVTISPNPFANEISVEKSIECDVIVYNSIGQIIYAVKSSEGLTKIDSKDWTTGLYIVVLKQNGNVVYKQKIISAN